MYYIREFIKAVLGGVCIALGGIAFIAIDSKIVGALFFTIGLYTICTFQFNLFTGKVCYVFENKLKYLIELILIWAGNFVGAFLTAWLVQNTRIFSAAFYQKVSTLCDAKLNDNLLSIFILSVFCNIFIYIAVEQFKNNPHELGKYIGLFLGVAGFILCGFEHCVANMFYFSAATKIFSLKTLSYLAVMTAGNVCGGILIPACRKYVIRN